MTLDGPDWLLVSDDNKRIYTEDLGSPTGMEALISYTVTATLNDGFLFGPNETVETFTVTLISQNRLPYFEPPLEPQFFEVEAAWEYILPSL